MIVYGVFYNPCYHESAEGLVSLHFSREGAEKALAKEKENIYNCWKENQEWCKVHMPEHVEAEYVENEWEYHTIREMEIVE